jgi:hypothetical protein
VYNDDDIVCKDICKILTLPLTPVRDVQDTFDTIENICSDVEAIVAYVETIYVKVQPARETRTQVSPWFGYDI